MPAIEAHTLPAGRARPDRSRSGTAFVVACTLAALAFVAFIVFVSPLLLAWTQAAAPPPAPQEVAAGEGWVATAVEAGEDEPCLELEAGGTRDVLCTGPRGGSLRGVALLAGDGRTIAYGIVDARTTDVRLGLGGGPGDGGEVLQAAPAYVDFGFPLGFFAVELPPGTLLRSVEARDRDGERRAAARCSGRGPQTVCDVAGAP